MYVYTVTHISQNKSARKHQFFFRQSRSEDTKFQNWIHSLRFKVGNVPSKKISTVQTMCSLNMSDTWMTWSDIVSRKNMPSRRNSKMHTECKKNKKDRVLLRSKIQTSNKINTRGLGLNIFSVVFNFEFVIFRVLCNCITTVFHSTKSQSSTSHCVRCVVG